MFRFLHPLLAVALLSPLPGAVEATPAPDRPNVLFIAVDDLRAELGCLGDAHILSPNIDRLAQRGMLFGHAYCQQAVCNPSRASMLTGLRPATLRLWDLPTHFRERRPGAITLPAHFKAHGYHAQGIGKIFHNWRQDRFRGDPASWSVPERMHYAAHGDDKPQPAGGLASPPDLSRVPRCEMRDVPDEAYFDGRIAAMAVAALEEQARGRDPFFLAVGFWKPHLPFNAPKRYWDLYDRDALPDVPRQLRERPEGVPDIALHDSREMLRGFRDRPDGRPTPAEVRALRHGYYAAISYVDAQVGKVIDALDRLGLADDTVVVFWSDHGFHLGEHDLWAKTSNFELDARVPLIIAAPGFGAGLRCDSVVELLDLFPTLSDLCGLPIPEALDGVSLRPLLSGEPGPVTAGAMTWHPRPPYPKPGEDPSAMGYSLRTERYRYTEWRAFPAGELLARELYDHGADPGETNNIAGVAALGETLESLAAQLRPHFLPADHP